MNNLLKLGLLLLCLGTSLFYSCGKDESGGGITGGNGGVTPSKNCNILERVQLSDFKATGANLFSFSREIAVLNNGELFFEANGDDGKRHVAGLRNGKKKVYDLTSGGSVLASNGTELYVYNFKGLFRFNRNSDALQNLNANPFLAVDLAIAPNGEVWGISDKLYRYQPSTGKTLVYETYNAISTLQLLGSSFVNGPKYQHLDFSPDGNTLYIAAGNKVVEWKISGDLKAFQSSANFKSYQLAQNVAFTQMLVAKTDGSIYVGNSASSKSAVYHLNRSSAQFQAVSTTDPYLIARATDGVWAAFSNGTFTNFKANQKAKEIDFAAFTPCADDYRKETTGTAYAFINNSDELWVARTTLSKGILFRIKF